LTSRCTSSLPGVRRIKQKFTSNISVYARDPSRRDYDEVGGPTGNAFQRSDGFGPNDHSERGERREPSECDEFSFVTDPNAIPYPLLGYQVAAFVWETGLRARGVLYSLYAVIFSLVAWTPALVWACFTVFRKDWIFHTPPITVAKADISSSRAKAG
jgi:hypothetical protein